MKYLCLSLVRLVSPEMPVPQMWITKNIYLSLVRRACPHVGLAPPGPLMWVPINLCLSLVRRSCLHVCPETPVPLMWILKHLFLRPKTLCLRLARHACPCVRPAMPVLIMRLPKNLCLSLGQPGTQECHSRYCNCQNTTTLVGLYNGGNTSGGNGGGLSKTGRGNNGRRSNKNCKDTSSRGAAMEIKYTPVSAVAHSIIDHGLPSRRWPKL